MSVYIPEGCIEYRIEHNVKWADAPANGRTDLAGIAGLIQQFCETGQRLDTLSVIL